MYRTRIAMLAIVMAAFLLIAPVAAAQDQYFISFATDGGFGLGLETRAGGPFSLLFTLQQKGLLGGLRYQLPSPDLYAGFYFITRDSRSGVAASVGTRIREGRSLLINIEGGLRSGGDLFALGSVGIPF